MVVVLGLVLTAAASFFTYQADQRERTAQFADSAEGARGELSRRIDTYATVLYGVRGLFDASDDVTRSDFARFINGYDPDVFFPHTEAFAFTRLVQPDDVAGFEAQRRNDPALAQYPEVNYSVRPTPGNEPALVADYVEPLATNWLAFGFDTFSEANRRKAAETARDTGQIAASAPVQLQNNAANTRSTMLVLSIYEGGGVPGTVAERRAQFIGNAVVAFNADTMLQATLADRSEMRVDAYDAGSATSPTERDEWVQISKHPNPQPLDQAAQTLPLTVGTRTWRLVMSPVSGTNSTDVIDTALIAACGMGLTVMLVALLTAQERARRRTARLAEAMAVDLRSQSEQLDEAHEMLNAHAADLRRSNTELEQFAYLASHDLQEPLRMVTGFVDRIDSQYGDKLDERGKRYVHYASDGAHRMQALISSLLEFSRVGRSPIDRTPINMNQLIKDVRRILVHEITRTGATFEVSDLPELQGDEVLLRELFQNLISNAIKFQRPDVKPIVRISAHPQSINEGGSWVISVEDNGIGVDQRHRKSIFDVFKRLHSWEEFPGAGIGLSIASRIAQRHGGEITVATSDLGGSRFEVAMPVVAPEGRPE